MTSEKENNSSKLLPFEITSLFEKKFVFKKFSNWELPPAYTLFTEIYNISFLEELKWSLNKVKSKLNDFPIEEWSLYTRKRNPAGEIIWNIRSKIEAEFVTQAWCKFYECLEKYPIVKTGKINSVHLCEAPGAFIAALNHYLYSTFDKEDIQWKWLASSLNPYYEGNPLGQMIIDDRFMLHTLDKWTFGNNFTGDILNPNNIINIVEKAKEFGRIDLVTADGSIDCLDKPGIQEEVVSPLHYAEVYTAINLLSEGGCFVIKMFTMFESSTVSLLYMLNCLFNEVNVFKPITSKCGNSEVYVICMGFDRNQLLLNDYNFILLSQIGKSNNVPIFPIKTISTSFLDQIEQCVIFFMNHQVNVIEGNIYFYINPSEVEDQKTKLLRNQVANLFISKYNVRKTFNNIKLLYPENEIMEKFRRSNIKSGSFTERSLLNNMPDKEKILNLKMYLTKLEKDIEWPYNEMAETLPECPYESNIEVTYGLPIVIVNSSLFVSLNLMAYLNDITEIFGKYYSYQFCGYCHIESSTANTTVSSGIDYFMKSNFSIKERLFFQRIINTIIEIKASKITFNMVAFVTHFSVSILYFLWTNVFKKLTFSKNVHINLEGRKPNAFVYLQKLAALLNTDNTDTILCLINIPKLHKNQFHDVLTNFNDQMLFFYCKILLSIQNVKYH